MPASPTFDHEIARRWLGRLALRDPALHASLSSRLNAINGAITETRALEGGVPSGRMLDPRSALETIVRAGRPVLPIIANRIDRAAAVIEPDGAAVVDALMEARSRIEPLVPLVGRIDVVNHPRFDSFVGTGWHVDADVIVTNRHVAEAIAEWDGRTFVFRRGKFGDPLGVSVDYLHELDRADTQSSRIASVIWIERNPDAADIAFLRLERPRGGDAPNRIEIADVDAAPGEPVAVIGYPARAPSHIIPDQDWMDRIYRRTYDIKRIAPGRLDDQSRGWTTHDCTTLGGNSGSVVLSTTSGKAVGLHFAGAYMIENYAVPASVIRGYLNDRPWQGRETRPPARPAQGPQARPGGISPRAGVTDIPPPAGPAASVTERITVTIPLVVTVALGTPLTGSIGPAPAITVTTLTAPSIDATAAAEACAAEHRGAGVIGARAGYLLDDGRLTDRPCIRAVVDPHHGAGVAATIPSTFRGLPVLVEPARPADFAAEAGAEQVSTVRYNDDSRTGPGFSLEPVEMPMSLTCHVGPERSWSLLEPFLAATGTEMVSSIYEFHADHIAQAIEAQLDAGCRLDLVLDGKSRDADGATPAGDFKRRDTFVRWTDRFGARFQRLFVPTGANGLVASSYHIKVTVRDGRWVWLSSGNWKRSSQPKIATTDRNNPIRTNAAGNREWHVVIDNPTLAQRFRSHLMEDFAESRRLGGRPEAIAETATWIDVPLQTSEAVALEAAPAEVLEPREFTGVFRVRPLLTPDRQGAVYTDAVLGLINSAQRQLLFQIPYINSFRGSTPSLERLVAALIAAASRVEDFRLILRSEGDWDLTVQDLKRRGMPIDGHVRHLSKTHTKGMVVDGRAVLIGSHNWSGLGVTLNRDASLIIESQPEIAAYFAKAFALDWERAREPIVTEAVVAARPRLASGDRPPAGFTRMRLDDYMEV